MRKKLYLFVAFLMLGSIHAIAQMDSLLLEAVEVKGIPFAKYAVGQKVVKIDSLVQEQYAQANIGDLLSATNPVYIRSYGNNMAAGISFRGTGPSHTGVFWNGLNINSTTLGQSDFSLLPVIGSDEISLQYGGSSSLYGSDAIGGTVQLNNTPNWQERTLLSVQQGLGSFGTYQLSAVFGHTKGKIDLKTRVYHQQSENNFTYIFPSTKESLEQNNASYKFYGLSQDINIQLASNKLITINGWYNSNQRELQPVMGNFNQETEQEDKNIRLTAAYHVNSDFAFWKFRTGYIKDYQLYDNASIVESKQIINKAQIEKKFKNISMTSGVNWNHIIGEADSYEGRKTQDRIDLFWLTTYQSGSLALSMNVRQNFISGYKAGFAPSLGAKFVLSEKWNLTSKLSRNYRVPTLNDRFWNPGGNKDLNSELSYNLEGGIGYEGKNLSWSANYYKMWVSDWIFWVPEANYWTPKNIQEVNSEGLESIAKLNFSTNSIKFVITAGYSLNVAVPTVTGSVTDRNIGRQLPYTPKHNANASFNIKSRWGHMSITSRFTGERRTLGSSILDSYFLTDFMIGKSVKSPIGLFNVNFNIKNITNQEYHAIINTAMPGRNYQLNINYTIQSKKQ